MKFKSRELNSISKTGTPRPRHNKNGLVASKLPLKEPEEKRRSSASPWAKEQVRRLQWPFWYSTHSFVLNSFRCSTILAVYVYIARRIWITAQREKVIYSAGVRNDKINIWLEVERGYCERAVLRWKRALVIRVSVFDYRDAWITSAENPNYPRNWMPASELKTTWFMGGIIPCLDVMEKRLKLL